MYNIIFEGEKNMLSVKYSEAAVEVLDILKHTREEDVKKIPKKFIEFWENNRSNTYISNLDHSKDIKDMNLRPETEAILGLIYMKYWANEEEKAKFEKKIKENERLYQEALREKYKVEKIFENKKKNTQEHMLVEVEKKTFWQKVIETVKSIFGR